MSSSSSTALSTKAIALQTTGGGDSNGGGGLSTQACTFFIFKLVVGSSAFCLPGAALGTGTAACVAMAGVFAALAGYCFYLVGRCCDDCGADSFQQLWERGGPPLRLPRQLLAWVVVALCFGTCLQFSISLGASLESIVAQLLSGPLGLGQLAPAARRVSTLAVTLLGILPLVLMPTLESLRFTTVLGSYSFLFAVCAIVWRCFDGTYKPSGKFFATAVGLAAKEAAAPSSSSPSSSLGAWAFGLPSVVLVSSMNTAYEAHCDPPRYLQGLRVVLDDAGEDAAKFGADQAVAVRRKRLAQFRAATLVGFAVSGVVYATIILAGRATFGDGVGDFLLSAYAPSDALMRATQLFTAFSMLCGYPLYFDALRKAVKNLLVSSSSSSAAALGRGPQMALLGLITFLATNEGIDLLFVMSVRGALLGSFVLFILPPALALSMGHRGFRSDPPLGAAEAMWLRGLLTYGLGAMVLATVITTGIVKI